MPLGVWRGHHQTDPSGFEPFDAGLPRVRVIQIAMQLEPLRGAFRHPFVAVPCIFIFDQMHVQETKPIGTSHHCTCISALVHIFQHHRKMACAVGGDEVDFGQPRLRQQRPQDVSALHGMRDVF